ncbi:MAG: NAD(P)H-hydrate dehydratase [Leptolyngbyaceae cyanobacterium MO_188.B28]|nr:NAD(P)H-hydrate dehydratase [Leptolyngbyaceae cyanobacterium MO_188.B28]
MNSRQAQIQRIVVTAEQMRRIEGRVFEAGMPVAALMEKVGELLARRIQALYPLGQVAKVGVLVGPGHNGGDALVIARELHFRGYGVILFRPFARLKDLTAHHAHYADSLGVPSVTEIEALSDCDFFVDGLFGFGLERPLTGPIATAVNHINQLPQPIFSIDLPSGVHTDTGAVLGTAIRATHTACLGLWKRAFLQDQALDSIGRAELIDFDLPIADIQAVLGDPPTVQRITPEDAIARLPLPRPAATHKYKVGHLLLVCGSQQYMGAAILAGLGASASGVGMLTLAAPAFLKSVLIAQLPEALILGCPETDQGAIAQLPEGLDLDAYSAIACGPGLTREAQAAVRAVLSSERPLLLDADGLNILADLNPVQTLPQRAAPTVLTPHPGEFKRLFPEITNREMDPGQMAQTAAQNSRAVVVLKGARVAIAHPQGQLWFNPESTPALARGGSGDVLTGLIGGLMAQKSVGAEVDLLLSSAFDAALSGVWLHAQAGLLAAQERTVLGVDPRTLAGYINKIPLGSNN